MDKEENKKELTIEDLMKQNLDFQNKINVLTQEKENVQNQLNDRNEKITSLENEVVRLQGVNQQFYLQLSNQDKEQINVTINEKQQIDNSMSFDDFINKLI